MLEIGLVGVCSVFVPSLVRTPHAPAWDGIGLACHGTRCHREQHSAPPANPLQPQGCGVATFSKPFEAEAAMRALGERRCWPAVCCCLPAMAAAATQPNACLHHRSLHGPFLPVASSASTPRGLGFHRFWFHSF